MKNFKSTATTANAALLEHLISCNTTNQQTSTTRGKLLWISAFSTLAFIFVVIWRPFGTSAGLHNVVTLILLGITCMALATAASLTETARQWGIYAIHMVVIGFLLRSIPTLKLSYPPLHDGYFYFVSLQNIVDGHSIGPAYQNWYGDVGRQLYWPVLQLLTAQMSFWSGVSINTLWIFLPPAIGALTFVTLSLITHNTYQSWRIAAIAGLIGSCSDLVLYYQSEYQPQGITIVVITFFMYMILVSRSSQQYFVRILMLMVGATFLFTHHASSLVVPFLLTPFLILPYFAQFWIRYIIPLISDKIRILKFSNNLSREVLALTQMSVVVLILIIAGLSMQIYLSADILSIVLHSVSDPFGENNGSITSDLSIWWLHALRFGKYILLLFSALGIILTLFRPTSSKIALVILTVGLLAASLGAGVIEPGGATRFLALWFPFGAIFAAAGISSFFITKQRWGQIGKAAAIIITCVYMMLGIVDSQIPAYLLDNTPRASGVWYGNALPRMDRIALAGYWLRDATPTNAHYAVDFSTRMAAFFFGERSDRQIIYNAKSSTLYCDADYTIVDYSLDSNNYMSPNITIDFAHYPRIYDNGSIAVFQHINNIPCY